MKSTTLSARRLGSSVGLAVALYTLTATAQPQMEPPRLTSGENAPYPTGAETSGEAAVELELIVTTDGTVSDAKVVLSAGPAFDEAALRAVRTFVFQPARKDGAPILSKVRYRMVFTPPEPPPPPSTPAARSDAASDVELRAAAPPVPEGAPLEFGATARIAAPPREATKRTLEAKQLLKVAGTRGDVLRAVELMPGVARPPAGMGLLIIRGSSPEDTQVLMDGVAVPRLYHFGGLTSFVQGRLIDRIDMYPGNFSARYGRKMGGIVEVAVRDPDTKAFRAMADVNFIDASALAEGPVTNRLSVAVAAKRSYVDAFLGAIADKSQMDIVAAPVYYDYQLLASWRPTDRDRVRTTIYGSADEMKLVLTKAQNQDPAFRGQMSQATAFHRAHTSWEHRFDSIDQNLSVSIGPFHMGGQIGEQVAFDGRGYDINARAEWRIRLGERLRLISGFDSTTLLAKMTYTGPPNEQREGAPQVNRPIAGRDSVSLAKDISIARPAGYAELAFEPLDRLLLVAGLRADWYGELEQGSVDPRLVARYELSTGTALKGGVGQFSQPPDYGDTLPLLGNPELAPSRAQHYTLGIEQTLGALSFSVEGFHKRLRDLIVTGDVPGQGLVNGGVGRIWGVELSGRAQAERGFAYVSYTLSRSRRNDHGLQWRAFDWDQPHILTMAGSLHLGRGWELGSTFRYVSGNPFTPVASSVYDASTDQYRPRYGGINTGRNDAFHQLDLRLEKQWRPSWGSLAAYLDVQNVYNHRNQEGRVYKFDFSQSQAIPGLPVFPSIGVRGEI